MARRKRLERPTDHNGASREPSVFAVDESRVGILGALSDMNYLTKSTSALVLACCVSVLAGCGKSAAPSGTKLTYKMDSIPASAIDTSQQTMEQAKEKPDPNIETLARAYDERHAKPSRPAVRLAAPTKPAAPAVEPPLAAKEDIDKAKARVAELRGSVKTAKNGAITGLTIESADATVEDMALFGKLLDLESISFLGANFNDEYLAQFKDLKKLTSITVQNSGITGASLETFAAYPELKSLDIRRDLQLENKDLKVLVSAPKLENLALYYNGFSNFAVKNVQTSQTIKSLDLRGCQNVDDGCCRYLIEMPALEEVYFRFLISDDGIEKLSAAPKLKFIELQDCAVTNACAESLVKFPALTGLRVFRSKSFDDGGVQGLAGIKLERLELRDLNVSNDGVLALKDMSTLRNVELSELGSVDSEALKTVLGSWKNLESLWLFSMATNDDVVKTIVASEPNLKNLTLRASVGELSDSTLEELTKLQNLESLDLRENAGFTLDGFKKLANINSLRKLYIKGTALGDSNQAALDAQAEMKKVNPKISFSNN